MSRQRNAAPECEHTLWKPAGSCSWFNKDFCERLRNKKCLGVSVTFTLSDGNMFISVCLLQDQTIIPHWCYCQHISRLENTVKYNKHAGMFRLKYWSNLIKSAFCGVKILSLFDKNCSVWIPFEPQFGTLCIWIKLSGLLHLIVM